jgi:TRAP transporter TAXI family solute receptor
MRDVLKVWGPVVAISLLVLAGTWWFVDPAPPRQLVLATGAPDGAYHRYGERLRDILARDGITVTLVESSGSLDNLDRLRPDAAGRSAPGRPDLAFVQSGVGTPASQPYLVGLASLYFEPLWVFVRGSAPQRLTELAGRRLAIGPAGSGTRDLALTLLAANGIGDGDAAGTKLLPLSGSEAVSALNSDDIDALFRVSAMDGPGVHDLLTAPDISLMSFERAGAYVRRFRFLSNLTLPAGVLDLATNLPDRDVTLLSPMASLVARDDLHPALVDLVLSAASEIFGPGGVFEEPGQFPSPRYVEFPLSPDAKRYFDSGLRFLHRYLPFSAATIVGQLLVLILPLIAIVIPLIRVGPPLYRWRIRHRIVRWYRDLRRIEHALVVASLDDDAAARRRASGDLDALQAQVAEISVPTGYADQLYHLRLHIGFVRQNFAA